MSTSMVEGDLRFTFGSRWTHLLRWDRHAAYAHGMARTHEGKAVDFLGVLDNRIPFFIEVKDYREHLRSDFKGPLAFEFELKIRATVAALVGVRWRDPEEDCVVAFERLRVSRRPRLVLWHEGDPKQGRAAFVAVTTDALKKNLGWLESQLLVTSSSEQYSDVIPDVNVVVLSPDRRRKIEEVVEILERRGKAIPPDVRWRLEEYTDLQELDQLILRAKTVREAARLFMW